MPNYLKKLLGSDFSEEMSIEEIGKLLEKQNLIPKSKLDKARSEVADLKKQQRQAMSEEEQIKAETADLIEQLKSTNTALQRENDLNKYTNKYLSQGYDAELALKAANATLDNDVDAIIECQNSYLEVQKAQIKQNILDGTTPPPTGEENANTPQAIQNKVNSLIESGNPLEAMMAMEQLNLNNQGA